MVGRIHWTLCCENLKSIFLEHPTSCVRSTPRREVLKPKPFRRGEVAVSTSRSKTTPSVIGQFQHRGGKAGADWLAQLAPLQKGTVSNLEEVVVQREMAGPGCPQRVTGGGRKIKPSLQLRMPTPARAGQSKALPGAVSSFSHTSSKTPTLVFPGN